MSIPTHPKCRRRCRCRPIHTWHRPPVRNGSPPHLCLRAIRCCRRVFFLIAAELLCVDTCKWTQPNWQVHRLWCRCPRQPCGSGHLLFFVDRHGSRYSGCGQGEMKIEIVEKKINEGIGAARRARRSAVELSGGNYINNDLCNCVLSADSAVNCSSHPPGSPRAIKNSPLLVARNVAPLS